MRKQILSSRMLGLLASLLAVIPVRSEQASTTDPSQFEREILPILSAHCFKCHGQDDPQAGLDLRTAVSVFKGSRNGPVVVKGASEKSLLFQKVSSHSMPPAGTEKSLDASQIEILRRWIDTATEGKPAHEGPPDTSVGEAKSPEVTEKDRQFRAFQRPVQAAVPKVKNPSRARIPIDAFVLEKLEAKGLTFSSEAAKVILMRPAYFDLIGLPPSPEEIQAYLADNKSGDL